MNDEKAQKEVFKDQNTQEMLNNPAPQHGFRDEKNKDFLEMIVSKINNGEIDLYKPQSLINNIYYDTLAEDVQGKMDMEAMNILSALREIKGLYDSGNEMSFQMENMVEQVRNVKERIELDSGDVFVI